ncbi:MAG: GMC family oxidoreductase [Candidatus Solibacter sp.]|jgi:choline dehydrogenase-like flavoprotein
MALKHVNAVIVGAGAGGGVVAKELSMAGLSAVLLERGKWYSAADCRKDDLYNQRTQVLGAKFGPDEERDPRVLVDEHGREMLVSPSDGGYSNNAACVGGGTFSYGAMAWRFMEKDFRMRSTYSAVEGSTLDDWPIAYSDLEPYYEKAEWEMGVSGDDSGNPFKAPRRKPLPMPPLAPNREHQLLQPAARRLGLHPFDIPMLRNTVPYNGRRACMRCRWCVGFACELSARTGTHNTVIPAALSTGNCELRTGCMTREILLDSRARATGVAYFDANRRLQEQPADLVIVCGGAIESARLLLNSKHRLFPDGLGNRNGWVGRNLQSHSYSGANGLFEFDTYDDLGPGASIAVSDYNHGNPGLAGGAVLANEFIRLPYQFMALVPPWVSRWGAEHKDFVRTSYRRTVVLMGPVQEMPLFDARVQLDPKVKDYWGIPVARLSGTRHAHTIEVGRFIASKAEAWLKEAGAVQTWKRVPSKALSGGQHQAGTCRMGHDPKTSVVGAGCRIHDVDNVYVIDASVHPTNGGFNPALTILANAYRASAALLQTWKGTKVRS